MTSTCDLILALDTSGPSAFVALADVTGEVLNEKKSLSVISHSEELSTLVQQCFDESKRKISELKSIVVGRGPGSFTGLRIGLSYTLGLASALSLKVIPISSAEGAAIEFLTPGRLVVVLGDARREEVFVAVLYLGNDKNTQKIIHDEIWSILNLDEKALELKKKTGATEVVYVSQDKELGAKIDIPKHIARGILSIFIKNPLSPCYQGPTSLSEIEPNYIRKVSAKTLKERQSARF